MRNAFIDELVVHAENNSNIVLVVGDLGYSVVEPFAERFPERFFNAGVAEQNMAALAAGLASEGYHVFIYSIANFPTFRCAEQIRNDIDYHNLPVTIVAVGGGLAYGMLGYSHHAVQDYALIRTFPNMLIAAPCDPMEVRACMRYLLSNPGPSYLRLGKAGEPSFHKDVPFVEPGKWVTIKKINNSADGVILSTGTSLSYAVELSNNKEYETYSVCTLPLWGQNCKNSQVSQVSSTKQVITFEDHLIDAGFGSWLCESCFGDPLLMANIRVKGLDPSVCGMVGSQDMLNKAGGLG